MKKAVLLFLNEHPERENGYSLWLALKHIGDEGFVLTMGDHLYSEDFIEKAMLGKGLIVDDLTLYTDREEATKVLCLKQFNFYDTGVFILDKGIEGVEKEREKLTLSEIAKIERARREILRASVKGVGDGLA